MTSFGTESIGRVCRSPVSAGELSCCLAGRAKYMSRHWNVRSTGLGRGLRALCSTVPLFLIFATLFIVPPVANAQEAVPTISSDKADYTPGETVIITGSNWQAGEAVDISVNDDIGQTWNHNSNPILHRRWNGLFTYSFQLPTSFVAIYTVTATGQLSGTATTTFTDAPLPASVSMVTWRTAPNGAWINGNGRGNDCRRWQGCPGWRGDAAPLRPGLRHRGRR